MLFKDAITGRDLLWYFVKNETNALYVQGIAELEGMGYEIPAVVVDGRKGLTWYDNIEMGIPNTTNLIDGHFSQLKRMLRNHNGMKRKRRDKLVIGFFEASKGITQ